MPKGKKQFQLKETSLNGRRAIKGLWGNKGKINYSDAKEANKHFDIFNSMCLQRYAEKNTEQNDNIQIETKQE